MSFKRQMSPIDEIILKRAALEVKRSTVMNLGIGLPTMLPAFLPQGIDVMIHSENGVLGMGTPVEGGTPDDPVIDAGGRSCKLVPGAACFDSVTSFSIVRSGRLDLVVLGAFEVGMNGDLANWSIPGKLTPGWGGGMEVAQKARHVLVLSHHLDKNGNPKLAKRCTLPLTAPACVDILITERAVFRRKDGIITVVEVQEPYSIEDVLSNFDFDVPVVLEKEALAA